MVEIPDVGQKVSLEVKTHNGTTIIEGILLHPSAKNHVTVKLVNGYNTSYPVDDVISIEITGTLPTEKGASSPVSYTHLRAHETCADLVCRLLLEKKKNK